MATPKALPLIYPNGPSASPLSDHGIENLAIRDMLSAEEALRLLLTNGPFDAPLFQRILTATAKECTFDAFGMSTFLDGLRDSEVWQVTELSKEWAMDAIKSDIGEDVNAVWWIIAHLICTEFVAIEDVTSRVVQVVSALPDGMVNSRLVVLIKQASAEPPALKLICQICALLCAETGATLNISMAVHSFLILSLLSIFFPYNVSGIGFPPILHVSKTWLLYFVRSSYQVDKPQTPLEDILILYHGLL